jgi:hypothetical protein
MNSSLESGGREDLQREIPPQPIDNVKEKQREMEEEGLGYL